ncbi:hypothetical protein T459_09907 [Capsicum annuum]|uniref:Ubiquitin-like protease family profile domain-containing protein n=1 Tax=Capsicum annuum TaxID=4072 RepID=A0A2G3A0S8_CAPAN|nr:hypothetical protein T459_09907 [Capsicum annuum]
MKKTKPDEKGECSKISSPVSSNFEPEEEKVKEILRDQIYMARVLPKFAPHIGCHTVNDTEHRIKSTLTKNQYNIFCNNRIFVVFMKKKSSVVQAQFGRCIMSLETKESTANVIVIRAKGTNLHFSPREFVVVTDLNCVSNKDDFVFDEDLSNRLKDYFGGAKYFQKRKLFAAFSVKIWGKDNDEDAVKFANLYFIHAFFFFAVDTVVIPQLHFYLVESGRYSDYPWGSLAFEELAKSLNKKLKPKDKFYMLYEIPLAIQIWLYECCSIVPRNVASRVDNQILRLLNWKTNAPRPRYESLMKSMFNEADVKVCFKNIEPTRKEISCFQISKKVVSAGVSHKDDEVNSNNDFQDPPHSKKYSITQKKHHGDSSSSPVKKKLKQQHKGLDEQTPKRTSPPRAAKKLSVRTSIFMLIQQKEKVASKRKDINRSANKKSIPIESPDSFLCSFGVEDDFISKKVFHKIIYALQVIEEINGNQSASLMEVYNEDKDDVLDKTDIDQHEARDICESPNSECDAEKIVDTSEGYQAEMNENKSPKDDSKKSKYDLNTSYKYNTVDYNFMNIINTVLAVYRIDDDSLNAGRKEYHLNEYINGFRMHVTVPWHTVDHIFIPINVKAKHHWVLAVISFNDRYIYVYDSLSSAGHDTGVLAEVEKLDEVIPICLIACKFYEKKGIDTANHPNYKSYDNVDLFDVYVVEDLPQTIKDCGLYMVTYAECLTFGDLVSPVDCDPDLIHTRYASILWNYDMKKEEENAQSDDEAPMRPPREIGLTKDTEILEI